MTKKSWQMIAGFTGFTAVVMGAITAHMIAPDSHAAMIAGRATFYQLFHAGMLFLLSQYQGRLWRISSFLFLIGIIFFCGSIYLYALDIIPSAVTAPLGGLSFMAGWLMIAFAAYKEKRS